MTDPESIPERIRHMLIHDCSAATNVAGVDTKSWMLVFDVWVGIDNTTSFGRHSSPALREALS